MAAISTANFSGGTGQYFASGAISGAPNLRASHSFGVRVKNGSTSTTIDSIVAAYVMNSGSDGSGSYFGRNNGIASTGMNVYRSNSLGTAFDTAVRSTCYGNTTTWYHLCFVYNASTGQIRFYINGAFIGQHASATTRTTSTTNCVFGLAQHPGKYADAFLFDRLLSDAEVTSMYDYRVPQVTSGLIGFWRLDSNATDTSGSGNNLGLTGTGTAISYSTADNPPQPEQPMLPTGSASTSGSAAVNRVYALGACTGVTNSSATAAVSLSNLAGSGPTRSPGWGDLMRSNGAESYRYPAYTTAGFNSSSATGPASGASARTFMCWFRWYEPSALNSIGGSSTFRVFGSGGTNSPWTMAVQVSGNSSGGPALSGTISTSLGTLMTRTTSALALDHGWHHGCVTYDGVDGKFFVDGVQVGSSAAISVPFDDTSVAANLFCPINTATSLNLADVAHAKFWSGVALGTTDIATEMANYRPVTNLASVRGYWPMSWSNPQWEAWGNVMTLNSAILHTYDDGNFGPNGTWPPVGNVAGATQTQGSAQVNRLFVITASSSTSTSATAAVAKTIAATASSSTNTSGSATVAFERAAIASTTTSGSAAVARVYDFASNGYTNTSATAAVAKTQTATASSSTQTSGTAAGPTAAAALVPTGNTTTSGSATNLITLPIVASGSGSTQGATALNPTISGSGSSSTSGTATVTADAAIVATGATQTLASANNQGALVVNAQTSTAGATSFDTVIQPKTADGASTTDGATSFGAATFTVIAGGDSSTSGDANLGAFIDVDANGYCSTQGTAQLTLIVGGLSRTQGLANVESASAIAASGSSSTSGQAVVTFGISASSQTATQGSAAIAKVQQLLVSGQSQTFGTAAFDGVAPVVGGGGGGSQASRRMLGALGTRRRIR